MRSLPTLWESTAEGPLKGPTDASVLEAAHRLVDAFLIFLREHETGDSVFDASELPATKDALINAFRVVIATENRVHIRSGMIKTGMMLAQFQENVGAPLLVRPMPDSRRPANARSRVDIATVRKVDRVILKLGEDRIRLAQVFHKASKLAEGKVFHDA